MKYFPIIMIAAAVLLGACNKPSVDGKNADTTKTVTETAAPVQEGSVEQSAPLVTFVELGSVNCIPCKKMQEVMKEVEKKYGAQVKVVFYDVNKEPARAKEYKIQLIPTQVFIDRNGKEFHRHEGYYPLAEIDKILQGQGVKAKG